MQGICALRRRFIVLRAFFYNQLGLHGEAKILSFAWWSERPRLLDIPVERKGALRRLLSLFMTFIVPWDKLAYNPCSAGF